MRNLCEQSIDLKNKVLTSQNKLEEVYRDNEHLQSTVTTSEQQLEGLGNKLHVMQKKFDKKCTESSMEQIVSFEDALVNLQNGKTKLNYGLMYV